MKRRVGAWFAASCFVAAFCHPAGADPTTILLVRSSNPALDERLGAELATLGFAVDTVTAADTEGGLDAIARAKGAVAAIRAEPGDDAVELWVEARPSAPAVREKVHIDARRGWNVAAVLALEALRAHLLDVRVDLPPSPPVPETVPVTPPPEVPAPILTMRARPWFWIHLGAGLDASPGGVGPAADLLLELRVEPRPWISIDAFGTIGPLANRVDAPVGAARLRHGLVGLGADLQTDMDRVTLSAGLGVALVLTSVAGIAPAPGYVARDDSTITLAPILRSGASIAVSGRLRVRISLGAGLTFPRTTVSFADREEVTWGRPFGLLTLGLEWGAIR